MTNTTNDFCIKAAGLPNFEIQTMFGELAAKHEPSAGLARDMTPDAQQEIFTHS